MQELQYLASMIRIYGEGPIWANLNPDLRRANSLTQNLCIAGLAECCKMRTGSLVPDPAGPYVRLTADGTDLIEKCIALLPESLRNDY